MPLMAKAVLEQAAIGRRVASDAQRPEIREAVHNPSLCGAAIEVLCRRVTVTKPERYRSRMSAKISRPIALAIRGYTLPEERIRHHLKSSASQ
jgi:hypothetical protein